MAIEYRAPGRDCPRCPRLVEYRGQNRSNFPAWHNAPVTSFGPIDAPLLIVGLAPGLRGANRSGRPFTGDYAGDLLFPTLKKHGFASGDYLARRDDAPWTADGFALDGARITNAVRCVPPQNKPLPAEIKACLPFLENEIAAMGRLRLVLALGRVAHDAVLRACAVGRSAFRFSHGAIHLLPSGLKLADSYHCSRYNTNTGVLTPEMFDAVIAKARTICR